MRPAELEEAMFIEAMAVRYHVLPAAVLAHPAWLLNHVQLVELGRPRGE